jgi:adenosylmethionine-8-amino-7-oxononanoate aminotransferase
MSAGLAERSVRAVWHLCTQMNLHEGQLPVAIARAQGPWLYADGGTRYLDGLSSWWENLFGHSPTRNRTSTGSLRPLANWLRWPAAHLPEET